MARSLCSLRVAAALVVAGSVLASAPAAAQFFNPFEALFGPPPRPPSSVPSGRQQVPPPSYPQAYPQYPDRRYDPGYQEQPAPGQANLPRQGPPAGGVQSEQLPPPPGSATASVDPNAPSGQPPLPGLPPAQRQPLGTPQPADTSPQPSDEVIAEPPSQKIENKAALFSGLDKITGRIVNFDATVGETVQFGALQVTPRICYTRPATETPNIDAFIEVDEVTLQGEVKRIFTGWVFASSPGLHAVEHPIYDVWLTDCKNPVVAAVVPPEPPPVAPTPPPTKPAATGGRRPGPQPPGIAPPSLPQTVPPPR
jgi:hypothetical protein